MAVSVKSKDAAVIVTKIMNCWISLFGPPTRYLLSDNGGEFNNDLMRSLGEQFDFDIRTTAGYSPFSNGICERHNATLTETFQKVTLEHPSLDLDSRLALSCMAKNTLYNNSGFTPCQVVFGRNFYVSNVIDNRLPALESRENQEDIAKHVAALQTCREGYIQAESSERIRRALRHNVREGNEALLPGETAFYKREHDKSWRGPGTILGIDGKIVFLRHGGNVIRAHRTHVMPDVLTSNITPNLESPLDNGAVLDSETTHRHRSGKRQFSNDSDDEVDYSSCEISETSGKESDAVLKEFDKIESGVEVQSGSPCLKLTDIAGDNNSVGLHDQNKNGLKIKPKIKSVIEFKIPGNEEDIFKAKVLSNAGKTGKAKQGKHQYCMNIEYLEPEFYSGKKGWIDCMDGVTMCRQLPDHDLDEESRGITQNEVFVMNSDEENRFAEAKQSEIAAWINHGVVLAVEDQGQPKMNWRWVLTMKELQDGSFKPKARLVLKGFEENLDKSDKESPVINREIVKLFI